MAQLSVLRANNWVFFHIGHSVQLPWIQTSLSKNLKLFSIGITELFESLVLWKIKKKKEKKKTGFCSVSSRETDLLVWLESLVLRKLKKKKTGFCSVSSRETDLLVRLGHFTVNKSKLKS